MCKSVKRMVTASFAAVLLTAACGATANAAEDGAEIKVADGESVTVQKGDVVKYSLYVSECAEDVVGVDMSLFYTADALQIDADSVTYENFEGVVGNPDLDGQMRFNWTSITDPVRPTADKAFVSAEFEVTSDQGGEISYFVTDMYGDDLTYLKNYKITCTVSVNGQEVSSQAVPIVNEDEAAANKLQGDFINYVDGRGEDDVDDSNRKTVVVEKKYISTEVVDVTKTVSAGSDSDSGSPSTFIIIAVAAVIILAIAAVVMVKQRDDKKKNAAATDAGENVNENSENES